MTEQFDEAVYAHVRASEKYQSVMGMLGGMAEDGDSNALEAVALINSFIPAKPPIPGPPIGKPQEVPPIRKSEAEKHHIKQTGKK